MFGVVSARRPTNSTNLGARVWTTLANIWLGLARTGPILTNFGMCSTSARFEPAFLFGQAPHAAELRVRHICCPSQNVEIEWVGVLPGDIAMPPVSTCCESTLVSPPLLPRTLHDCLPNLPRSGRSPAHFRPKSSQVLRPEDRLQRAF